MALCAAARAVMEAARDAAGVARRAADDAPDWRQANHTDGATVLGTVRSMRARTPDTDLDERSTLAYIEQQVLGLQRTHLIADPNVRLERQSVTGRHRVRAT